MLGAITGALAGLIPSPITNTNIYSAVGNGDVVRMEYELWLGSFDNEPHQKIADTTSFTDGISLSEIKWGYINTSNGSENGLGTISFTLHDIAGGAFATFIKLRRGTHFINFKCPNSTGALNKTDKWAVYYPQPEECKIDFNATQGFTYTFVGSPIVQLGKTKTISLPNQFIISGSKLDPGSNFEQYLNGPSGVKDQWNNQIVSSNSSNKIGPRIAKFVFVEDDKLKYEENVASVRVKLKGGEMALIEDFPVKPKKPIEEVVRELFNSRFKADADIDKRTNIEVNFVKWQGDGLILLVRFQDKTVEKVNADVEVCIGSDTNCTGAKYRAQLSNIQFNDSLISGFIAAADIEESESGDQVQSGNASGNLIEDDDSSEREGEVKGLTSEMTKRKVIPTGQGGSGMWGQLDSFLEKNKIPGFTLEIEMPYSFGFSPAAIGGLLKDSIHGGTGVGIHYTQGVALKFFWYTDPTCQVLELRPEISKSYRITNVSHTIGLNGNTTTVGLSHLHIK